MNYWQKKYYKLTHWEFWSFSVFYFPVYFYFTWLSIKAKSFFFFTSANPKIDFGGMLGEKKSEIFDQIPKAYIPKTYLISQGDERRAIEKSVETGYPLIAKPNIGERGRLVEKIYDQEELMKYVKNCPVDFLLQELVDFPIELGVFYVRMPEDSSGRITSIVQKGLMKVVGDGQASVKDILKRNSRALLQVDFDHPRFLKVLKKIPARGEELIIEPIGNHNRGTIFLDSCDEIDAELETAIDKLAKEIPDFYFGRFDLLCQSFDDLRRLKNFKIVELNGVGAEPGHIYQPGFSLFKAYSVVFKHFYWLGEVSRQNAKKGHAPLPFKKGMAKLKSIKLYNRMIEPFL